MTRDSSLWWFGIVGAVLTGLASNLHMFPWLSESAQHWITFGAFIVGIVSAAMKASPLPHSEDR